MLIQSLVNGLVIGAIYILMALGLTLLYGVLHMFNFAHGEIYMLGAFSVYFLCEILGLNYFVGILGGAVVGGLLGTAIYIGLLRPLRGNWVNQVIIGLGLSRLIVGLSWQAFGTMEKSVSPPIRGLSHFFGLTLSVERIVAALIGLLAVGILYWVIKTTRLGRAIRATEQDAEVATAMGVNIDRICTSTCAIGFAMAAVSGAIVAPIFTINPAMGDPVLFKAFVIIIIGGLGSVRGCIIGGLLLGLVDSVAGATFGPQIAKMLSFSFVMAILIFRPEGIGMHRV